MALCTALQSRLSCVNDAATQTLKSSQGKNGDTLGSDHACEIHRDAFGAVYVAPRAAAKHGLLLRFNARRARTALRSVLERHEKDEHAEEREDEREVEEDVECRSILPSVLARRGATTTTKRSASFAAPDMPTTGDEDEEEESAVMDRRRRRVRMLVSRYGETCCLERGGKVVVVSMHSPLRTVENFLLGDEGDTAEVCPSTTVSARGSPARAVLHMSFHPDSASHFCLLMDGNVFLIYNVAENARAPEQSFELRANADVVSFCFPASTSQHVSGWTRFAVLFVDVHGGIASLCPVLPGRIKMVSHLVPSVSDTGYDDDDDNDDDDEGHEEEENGGGFGGMRRGEDRYAACCTKWVTARFPELRHRQEGVRGVEGDDGHGGAGIPSGNGDSNAAPKTDVGKGRPTSVLVSRPAHDAAACVPMLYALPMTSDDADAPPSRSYSRLRRIHYVKVSGATEGGGSGDTGIGVLVSACYYTGTIRVYLVFPDLKPVWDFAPDVRRRGPGAQYAVDAGSTVIRMATEESCSRSFGGDDGDAACVGPPRRQTQELVLVDAKNIGDARSGGNVGGGVLSSTSLPYSAYDAPSHDVGGHGILDIVWNYTDNTRLLLVRDVDVHVLTLSLLSTLTALGVHGGSDMQIGEDIHVPSCVVDRIYSARDSGRGNVTGAIMTDGDVLCVTDAGEVLSSPLPATAGGDDAQLTITTSTSEHGALGDDDDDDDPDTESALRALVADFNAKVNSGGGGASRSPMSPSSSESATTLEFSPPPKLLNGHMSSKTPADSVEGQKLLASSLRDFRSRYLGYAHRVHAALRARKKHQDGASVKNANLAEKIAQRIAKLKRSDVRGGCTSQALRERVQAIRDLHAENSALLCSLKDTAAMEAASGGILRRENSVGEKILIENLSQLEDQIIPHLRERLAAFSASLNERSAAGSRETLSTRHHITDAASGKILLSDATMWKVREALANNDTIVRANVADVGSLNQSSM